MSCATTDVHINCAARVGGALSFQDQCCKNCLIHWTKLQMDNSVHPLQKQLFCLNTNNHLATCNIVSLGTDLWIQDVLSHSNRRIIQMRHQRNTKEFWKQNVFFIDKITLATGNAVWPLSCLSLFFAMSLLFFNYCLTFFSFKYSLFNNITA